MYAQTDTEEYNQKLVNAIMYHSGECLTGINGFLRPGIVHRIDMDTTGSLLICKNDHAHQILAEELKEHSITRRYHAIVHGNLKEDRKSTRLNSSHVSISYAVFCLKKKK